MLFIQFNFSFKQSSPLLREFFCYTDAQKQLMIHGIQPFLLKTCSTLFHPNKKKVQTYSHLFLIMLNLNLKLTLLLPITLPPLQGNESNFCDLNHFSMFYLESDPDLGRTTYFDLRIST